MSTHTHTQIHTHLHTHTRTGHFQGRRHARTVEEKLARWAPPMQILYGTTPIRTRQVRATKNRKEMRMSMCHVTKTGLTVVKDSKKRVAVPSRVLQRVTM